MSGEKETTEPQALVSTAETMHDDGMIERLRKVLDEVRTNQAEHASHLDHLAHRADLERTKRATDRMRLNGLAQEVKELRDRAATQLQPDKQTGGCGCHLCGERAHDGACGNRAVEHREQVRQLLQIRMQERLAALLTGTDKIPYTDDGIARIEGQVRAQLQDGVDVGGLSLPFTVTVPKAANPADRANRILRNVVVSVVVDAQDRQPQVERDDAPPIGEDDIPF